MIVIPKFWNVELGLIRRLPPKRKAAAVLAACRAYRPEASFPEVAVALGISESTARRWAGWLAELDTPGADTSVAPKS